MYGRKDFEKMTSRKYEYIKGLNGHFEIALYVDTFEEVDSAYEQAISKGAKSVLPPETEPWGQRTCYIADPENNLIEIGSFNRPFDESAVNRAIKIGACNIFHGCVHNMLHEKSEDILRGLYKSAAFVKLPYSTVFTKERYFCKFMSMITSIPKCDFKYNKYLFLLYLIL